MGSANLAALKSKVIGPLPPGDFSSATAIQTAIDAGFDAVTDADTADTIVGLEMLNVLGNAYLVIIYKA
tara:strand:+ start:472 stop:678 length:207 start_codon:yes stop_codon:yes gene_type:complete